MIFLIFPVWNFVSLGFLIGACVLIESKRYPSFGSGFCAQDRAVGEIGMGFSAGKEIIFQFVESRLIRNTGNPSHRLGCFLARGIPVTKNGGLKLCVLCFFLKYPSLFLCKTKTPSLLLDFFKEINPSWKGKNRKTVK